MDAPLSEQEIENLLSTGNLRIRKNVNWKFKKNLSHYEFQVPVEYDHNGANLNLRLVGIKNAYAHRYSFLLLLDDLRIRALDPFKIHINRNPHREKIFPPHKHKWCDLYKDTIAYHPDDITDPSNIELTFMQFVKECNITMEGKFNHPPQVQMELPI